MRIDLPVLGEAYQSRWAPIASQRCVNLYLTVTPEGQPALVSTPGLSVWAYFVNANPVRAMCLHGGTVWAVCGDNLYEVEESGLWTLRDTGAIASSGLVSMASNGDELLVVDGVKGFIYEGGTLSQIVDADFPTGGAVPDTCAFMDGYFILGERDTGQFFLSDLYDGTSYAPENFATAESAPDNLLRILVDHRELWLFGEVSTEVWYNSGEVFPFSRIPGASMNIGLAAKESPATINNIVFWLGHDKHVYRADSYQPVAIGNEGVNSAIAKYKTTSDACGYCYSEEGHFFYVLTFPTEKATWVYDITTGKWAERASYPETRHYGQYHVEAYGKNLVSDFRGNGVIHHMSLDNTTDVGEVIRRIRSTAGFAEKGEWAYWGRVGLVCNPGDAQAGDEPEAILRYSDDGGRTWSNELWEYLGSVGEYQTRVEFGPLGRSKERAYEFTLVHDGPVAITGAWADIE